MNDNLPATPGPYWWRANAGDEWAPVFVREDSTVPGYEFTVIFPETGVEIDLPDMRGQWAKAHTPDEGIEAFMVFDRFGRLRHLGDVKDYGKLINRPWQDLAESGYTCDPVTIFRKEKE